MQRVVFRMAAQREAAEAPADDAVAEAAPEGEAPPAAEGEAPSATEVEPAAAESAAAEAVPSADGAVEPPAEGATEGAAEGAAEGAEPEGAAEASMPRLLAADAQRSDGPDLEAPVPAAAACPSPDLETAPTMQRVTGTFADPSHESAFAAQLFRMAYPAHVPLLAVLIAYYCWCALLQPDKRRYFVVLVLLCALSLVGRVLLHRTGSRNPVRSQRLGGWVWAVLNVLGTAVDMVGFIATPAASCAAWEEPKYDYLLPFDAIVFLLFALVNGSHGLGLTCKLALMALLLTDCTVSMTYCDDPFLDPWFICAMGAAVVGAAATHTAELYARRSYAEKVRAAQGRAEEAGKRRQLEERVEQLQAEKERLFYDMQRRGRPLDDDDRSAICRGLQAARSQPYRYPPSLGDTAPDADSSEAAGPAPSDSLPTLPPGPPSSASSGSVAQLVAEALADMAMNAVAPQQNVRMAAHQPEVHRPTQRATPALCFSKQGLDSTEVATAASVQQLDANGVSAQAIHPHRTTQPLSTSAHINAAAPTCGKQATALEQKFATCVMRDFTPRHPDDLPLSQWVSYDRLYELFQPHAPLDVWQKGPGNLKQLIIEWYQGDPAFTGLAPSAWCKQRVIRQKGTCYFCFEYRPNGRRAV